MLLQNGASKQKGPVLVQEHVPKVKVSAEGWGGGHQEGNGNPATLPQAERKGGQEAGGYQPHTTPVQSRRSLVYRCPLLVVQ
jgi:hypothetical protein